MFWALLSIIAAVGKIRYSMTKLHVYRWIKMKVKRSVGKTVKAVLLHFVFNCLTLPTSARKQKMEYPGFELTT